VGRLEPLVGELELSPGYGIVNFDDLQTNKCCVGLESKFEIL